MKLHTISGLMTMQSLSADASSSTTGDEPIKENTAPDATQEIEAGNM